jgi:hypothetical protein
MGNQEFKVDASSGTVVFCQKAHGVEFVAKSKAVGNDKFNVGIGQLIAMKRVEIAIRKEDIKEMSKVVNECKWELGMSDMPAKKLWSNFIQFSCEKISMSRAHIRQLEKDLDSLYSKTYEVRPYAEIIEIRKEARKARKNNKSNGSYGGAYMVPKEIVDGTHMFEIINGSVTLKPIES